MSGLPRVDPRSGRDGGAESVVLRALQARAEKRGGARLAQGGEQGSDWPRQLVCALRRASLPATQGVSRKRRLLDVLQQAAARPVSPRALVEAGIQDPGNAIFELERAGDRIERI